MSGLIVAAAERMTLAQAWDYGGWLMWVLLAMSVAGVAICLYFLATLRVGTVVPVRLRRDLPKYLLADDPNEARRLCEDVPSPLASVMVATLDAVRNAPRADAADAFMEKVDSVKIEIQQPDGSLSPVRCSEPEPMDFNPEAALGTLVDFTRESPDLSRILWIISMKNGISCNILIRIRTKNNANSRIVPFAAL